MSKIIPTLNKFDKINEWWLPNSAYYQSKNIIEISNLESIQLGESPTGSIFNKESSYVKGDIIVNGTLYENTLISLANFLQIADTSTQFILYTDARYINIVADNINIIQNANIENLVCEATSNGIFTVNLHNIDILNKLTFKGNKNLFISQDSFSSPKDHINEIDCFNIFPNILTMNIIQKTNKVNIKTDDNYFVTTGDILPVDGCILETYSCFQNTVNNIKNISDELRSKGYIINIR